MGRGDVKTKRGKRTRASFGNSRPKMKNKKNGAKPAATAAA